MTPFRVAILVLSDTCSVDALLDGTTATVKAVLATAGDAYDVTTTAILADTLDSIQQQLILWCSEATHDLVLTCGGTGFTDRDTTPEAVRPLLHREAPGLVHLMLSASLAITPFAAMARPVAGIRNRTLVLTLPGSPKGAAENLEAVMGVLAHALSQLGKPSARSLHQAPPLHPVPVASIVKSPHSHCGLKTHTLSAPRSNMLHAPVTLRARASPFPMVPVSEALALIAQHTPSPRVITKSLVDKLVGFALAEAVVSSMAVPPFPASIVDGYAVHSADGPGTYPVVTVTHASATGIKALRRGEISRITTGAPVPLGADAVVMVEETELVSSSEGEEREVKILAEGVAPMDNIRAVGSDVAKGAVVMAKGCVFTKSGAEVGVLASVGVTHVKVYHKPCVGILSTGNELVDLREARALRYGEVYDSNRPTLLCAVEHSHLPVVDCGIVADDPEALAKAFRNALNTCDVLITTGGVSMGERDYFKLVVERSLGGTIHFGRVAMKPGKPTTFATVVVDGTPKLIFGLPGNPASASVTFTLFVLPSVRQQAGLSALQSTVSVELGAPVRLDQRPEFQRVWITQQPSKDHGYRLVAESTGYQRSSRIASMKGANGLVCLPSSNEGGALLPAGSIVKALLIDGL